MEVKKSPKADLEGKKSTWLLIGYVFILALMFVAFEWTERDKQVTTDTGMAAVVFEEEMVPITEQEEQQQAPPPEVPKAEEIIEIVENDAKVEETVIQASDDTEKAVEVKYTGCSRRGRTGRTTDFPDCRRNARIPRRYGRMFEVLDEECKISDHLSGKRCAG